MSFFGSEGRVAMRKEASYPTKDSIFPTTGFKPVELTAENVGIEQGFVSLQTLRGTNVPSDEVPTILRAEGDSLGVVYAPENGIGKILEGAFGKHTAYEGVYVPKENLGWSDGATTEFTASNAPATTAAPERLYVDGVLVDAGDYAWDEVLAKVTFNTAPAVTELMAAATPAANMSLDTQPAGKSWLQFVVTAGAVDVDGIVTVTGKRNGVRNISENIDVSVLAGQTKTYELTGKFSEVNANGIDASDIIAGDTETISVNKVLKIELQYFRYVSGLYSHVFEEAQPGESLPSYAMTEDRVVHGGVFGWNGVMVNELSMTINTDGFIVGDAAIIGMREFTNTEDDIEYPTGLTYSDLKPFLFRGTNLYLNDELNVDMESLEWSMNNNLEGRPTISRTNYITKIRRGSREIEVNLSRLFENMELYMAFKTAENVSIITDTLGEEVVSIPGEYYHLIVEMPKLRLTENTPGLDASSEAVEEPTAKALPDPVENYAIRVVVVNTESGI